MLKHLKITFLERSYQKQPVLEIKMSREGQKLVETEVQELLREQGHLLRVQRINFSAMFLRPKKDGCFRPAMNLENLSQFIPYSHIKMDSLKQVKHLLHQKGLMVKSNLQDTYFSVSHPPETQKYLRFQWEVNLYQFLYLCFCLGLAPRIFTNLSRQHSNNRQEPGGNLNESRQCNSQDTHNHVHDIFGFFGGSANFINHK